MQKNKVFVPLPLLLLCILLQGCDTEPETRVPAPPPTLQFPGEVLIEVQFADELNDEFRVDRAVAQKPGPRNAIDLTIQIRNRGTGHQRLRAEGAWKDERGNRHGGLSQLLEIAAGNTAVLQAGTNSTVVTRFRLDLSATAVTAEELSAATLTNPAQRVAEGYGMTFSATAADEIIPALPIRGSANGQPFTAGTLVFRESHTGSWHLEISDATFDPLGGPALARSDKPDVQTMYLNLPEEPVAGTQMLRDMAYGGGHFQIKPSPESEGTTSWNTSIAWQINIDTWDKGPTVRPSCGRPDLGRASGTLYISFQGGGMGPEDSWVSGQFSDAPILYCGTP